MTKPLKIILGIFIFYFTFSIALGSFEVVKGERWYTYKNYFGDTVIMGQKPASLLVKDEDGNAIDIVKGYAFPDSDAVVIRKKDSSGNYIFVQNQELPAYIKIVEIVFYPVLSVTRTFFE